VALRRKAREKVRTAPDMVQEIRSTIFEECHKAFTLFERRWFNLRRYAADGVLQNIIRKLPDPLAPTFHQVSFTKKLEIIVCRIVFPLVEHIPHVPGDCVQAWHAGFNAYMFSMAVEQGIAEVE
jgi:hypothetical protein